MISSFESFVYKKIFLNDEFHNSIVLFVALLFKYFCIYKFLAFAEKTSEFNMNNECDGAIERMSTTCAILYLTYLAQFKI